MHRLFYILLLVFGCPSSRTTARLPQKCFNPLGKSCNWYRECLDKKYPCEASSSPYALAFAEKFCKRYDARKSLFNQDEWSWVDGVRKCLQIALVPLLQQKNRPTCKQLRNTAFKSHIPCYFKPAKNVPSICDLGCGVYIKIFTVIKGSLTSFDTAWEVIKAMWNIGKKCGFKCRIWS